MTDPQELANRIGEAQRATESALHDGDINSALVHATAQHGYLTEAFAFVRDELGLNLDWDQVAGNGYAKDGGGMRVNGGGAKDAPSAN